MRDFFLHQIYQMTPAEFVLIMAGCVFIGFFLAIIIRLKRESVNWIESDVKPWRREVIIGYRGSAPVYDLMYSARFVQYIYEKNKGYQARLSAIGEIKKI